MNQLPLHPLQSPEWGQFREKTGVTVISVAPGFQMTLHDLPMGFKIGYLPKCSTPTKEILKKLKQVGKEHNCIFIKLEPNTLKSPDSLNALTSLKKSPHPLFTNYTFHIDLTKSENELLKQMKSKTRYNVRVAEKHNVTVVEDNSDEAFELYINLSKQTWERKGFRAHGEDYHRTMWEVMHGTGIAHLLIAYYTPNSQQSNFHHQTSTVQLQTSNIQVPLATWILFLYKDVLHYPYGASSSEYKDVMASNLIMWEAMKWGKKHGAKLFDLWGALSPEPDKTHDWYGFHKFKEGYGGELVEYVGSYDLMINPVLYQIYNMVYPIRQKMLNM